MEPEKSSKLISMKEVEEHNSVGGQKSIWMVIHDKVYDVTNFLDEHPGGEEILIEHAGQDATEPFEDVGHSSDSREMMAEYLIGELNEEDRKGNLDSGPKSWQTENENGPPGEGWGSWILAAGLAFAASMVYRIYFTKE